MAANSSYKKQFPLMTRQEDVALAKERFPHLIPVILENGERSQYPDLPEKRHFVSYNVRVGNFANQIWYMLNLNPAQSFFLFATNNSKLLRFDTLMSAVYTENMDKEDGALYITYSHWRSLGPRPNLATAAKRSYRQQYSLEQRRAHFALAKDRHPNMIPVILENAENSHYPDMARKMYFVPKNGDVGAFADFTRFNLNLDDMNPVILSTMNNGKLLSRHALMSTVYDLNKVEDGALYMEYSDRFPLVQR